MFALAGTVILYNPDSSVLTNIQSYLSQLSVLYIFDNTEQPDVELVSKLKSVEKVIYFNEQTNLGIADRLNKGSLEALKSDYNWLLTMDQDSFFRSEQLELYLTCLVNFPDKENVAMFGVEYEKEKNLVQECTSTEVSYLITSGSIVNLSVFKKIGGFDEHLFIDEVDLEYCYRARSKGYKVVKFESVFLQHHLGKVIKGLSLKTFKQSNRVIHSPLRIYYMIRNYLYVNKIYPHLYPIDNPHRRKSLLNRLKNNFLYGPKKLFLIKMMFKAYSDFKKGNMGKL